MNFLQQLAVRVRERHAELEAQQRELDTLIKAQTRAAARYQEMCDTRVDFLHPGADAAHRELVELNAQVGRQRDLVGDLRAEVQVLEQRVEAPARLKAAVTALAQRRAEAVSTVDRRQRSADKVSRLEAQHAAELAAATAGREWQEAVILSRIEGTAPPTGAKPEHSPAEHQQTADVLAGMVEAERAACARLDAQIAELRATEREAEREVLAASAAARELEFSEGLASLAPLWSRFVAAHRLAFDYAPSPPDMEALSEVDAEQAEADARAVLVAAPNGLLQRAARKLGEVLA